MKVPLSVLLLMLCIHTPQASLIPSEPSPKKGFYELNEIWNNGEWKDAESRIKALQWLVDENLNQIGSQNASDSEMVVLNIETLKEIGYRWNGLSKTPKGLIKIYFNAGSLRTLCRTISSDHDLPTAITQKILSDIDILMMRIFDENYLNQSQHMMTPKDIDHYLNTLYMESIAMSVNDESMNDLMMNLQLILTKCIQFIPFKSINFMIKIITERILITFDDALATHLGVTQRQEMSKHPTNSQMCTWQQVIFTLWHLFKVKSFENITAPKNYGPIGFSAKCFIQIFGSMYHDMQMINDVFIFLQLFRGSSGSSEFYIGPNHYYSIMRQWIFLQGIPLPHLQFSSVNINAITDHHKALFAVNQHRDWFIWPNNLWNDFKLWLSSPHHNDYIHGDFRKTRTLELFYRFFTNKKMLLQREDVAITYYLTFPEQYSRFCSSGYQW